jgi:hypothetical protein
MDEVPFTELLAGLRRHGREADAAALDSLRVVGWMSSPQMVGELGRALRELELPDDLQDVAERCRKEIRRRQR